MTNGAMNDVNTSMRLARAVSILATIESRRRMVGAPGVGANIERMLVDRELRELEEDIARDPGALVDRLDAAMVQRRKR